MTATLKRGPDPDVKSVYDLYPGITKPPAATVHTPKSTVTKNATASPKTVISMSLCVSPLQTSVFAGHDHSRKPFSVAAALATRLWLQQDPNLTVVVGLVSSNDTAVEKVTQLLVQAGAHVWIVPHANASSACVRMGQLARLFAHQSPYVHQHDWMVTSDVDAFPYNVSQRLAPLQRVNALDQPYQAWVSSYWRSWQHGNTMSMCFLGMTASRWNEVIGNISLQDLTHAAANMWFADQLVATASLARSKVCAIRSNSAIFYPPTRRWLERLGKSFDLPRDLNFNDSLTCNKGSREWNDEVSCTNEKRAGENCSWIHFYPNATRELLLDSYEKIAKLYPRYVSASDLLSGKAKVNKGKSTRLDYDVPYSQL